MSAPPLRSLRLNFVSLRLCVVAAFAVFVFLLVPRTLADPDIWWHLRDAQIQLQSHTFLTADVFSFSAHGASWMDHEWLAELPFYVGWRLLGARGVFLTTVLAIQTVLLGVFHLAYRRSRSLAAAAIVSVVAALLSTVSFGPRTLLFGWICLIGELMILEYSAQHRQLLFALPALFAIWVNTHGSWLIGMVLLSVSLAGSMLLVQVGAVRNYPTSRNHRRALLMAWPLSAAALFLNPYGWRLVAYPFDLAFHQKLNISNVEEWRTLDFHTPRGHLMLAVLAGLFLSQLLRRRTWSFAELAFLGVGIVSAIAYSRFLFLAAILVMPIVAKDVALFFPVRERKRPANKPLLHSAILFMLAPLVFFNLPSESSLRVATGKLFPVQALPIIRSIPPQARVLNDFLWGGFLIWHNPAASVFIDSRIDLFERNSVFGDYLDAIHLKNTLAILDKYDIRFVVFERDAAIVYLLKQTAAWKVNYEDETTCILERRIPEPPNHATR